jgi:hypothetical protein
MGWMSDFISDPIGTVSGTVGDVVGGAVGAVRGVTGGLAGGIENITGLNLSNPATLAALGLAAYGYMNPEMFGGTVAGETGGEALSGLDLGGAGGSPATWGSTLSETTAGQAGNILAKGAAEGLSPVVPQNLDKLAMGPGVDLTAGAATGAPTAAATAATEPWSLSTLGNTVASGAKDVGNYIMKNPLPSAMIGSSLYDMYAKSRMADQLKKQREQQRADIENFYAPGSPEYNRLMQESKRQAAAAGRSFSSEQFQAEVAGKIAERKMQALGQASTSSNQLLASQMNNQYGGLNSLMNNMAMYTLLKKQGYV